MELNVWEAGSVFHSGELLERRWHTIKEDFFFLMKLKAVRETQGKE